MPMMAKNNLNGTGENMEKGKVFFVATPIGNLGDITLRALEVLKSCDYIACEDTRHSAILLNHYEIKKPTFSYHKFNETRESEKILTLIANGKNVAVISDAGMPIISDPGAILVRELIKNKIDFEMIPGANAGVSALALSGLDATSFVFGGFLPEKKQDRIEYINRLARAESTMIFYSACHDIKKDLNDLFSILGNRQVSVSNDITKKFEQTFRGRLGEIEIESPRGEFVIVVEGQVMQNALNKLDINEHIQHYLSAGVSRMEALKLVARDRNMSKSEIYKASLNNKK